jgi:hypothetical protein
LLDRSRDGGALLACPCSLRRVLCDRKRTASAGAIIESVVPKPRTVLALAVVLIAMVASRTGAYVEEAHSLRTDVFLVSPVTSIGRLAIGYKITTTAHGGCGPSPVSTVLYECFWGNEGRVVCWTLGSRHDAVCSDDLRSRRLIEVTTSQDLRPTWGTKWASPPLGVELADGLFCSMTPGTPNQFAGLGLAYYFCQRSVELLNQPNTKRSYWTETAVQVNSAGHVIRTFRVYLRAVWIPTA